MHYGCLQRGSRLNLAWSHGIREGTLFQRMAALLAGGLGYKIVENRISTVRTRAVSLDLCIFVLCTFVLLTFCVFVFNRTSDYTSYFLLTNRLFPLILVRY